MPNVFLSYSRQDQPRAAAVAAALERAGLSVWWDESISGGEQYSKEIEKALLESAAVVVLWSKASVESPWVRDEAAKGRDSGKLIPARLDATEPPLGFGQFHTIDLSKRRSSKPLNELVASARRLVGKVPPTGKLSPRKQPTAAFARLPVIGTAVAALVLAALALFIFVWKPFESKPTNLDSGKVAIEPFETLSRDSETGRLARLTTEAIERVFAQNFISTISAKFASADALADADFGVRGTIDHEADTTAASVAVTDLKTGTTLWSTRIERPSNEAGEIPEQTAIWLADVLRCSSDFSRRMAAHRSLELLRRILRYCDATRDKQFEQLPKLGKELVEIAPKSGEAHALEAFALALASGDPGRRGPVYAAAKKALDLDPDNGVAVYAIAAVPNPAISIAERERMLRQAIDSDPGFGWTKQQLAAFMRKVGRFEEARRIWLQFTGEYPLDYSQRAHLAALWFDAGKLQTARQEFEVFQQLRPTDPLGSSYALRTETFMGDTEAARRWVGRMDLSETQRVCTLRVIDAVARKRAGGPATDLGECRTKSALPPAQIDVALGNVDRAYRSLYSDAGNDQQGFSWFGQYFIYERWAAAFRADPRFMPLMAKDGRAQYWLETGKWPDFCREEKLPYDCRQAARAAVAGDRAS